VRPVIGSRSDESGADAEPLDIVVSSKLSVKGPDSPQEVGVAAAAVEVGVWVVEGSVTTVSIVVSRVGTGLGKAKDGRVGKSRLRWVRVVRDRESNSVGSGPVTVGYVPVQYEIVVKILVVGKTKLICASP
jgi:hypothetical protein